MLDEADRREGGGGGAGLRVAFRDATGCAKVEGDAAALVSASEEPRE